MGIAVTAGTLAKDARPLIVGLGPELRALPDAQESEAFLVANASESHSRHQIDLGAIPGLDRFTACHRWEPYWMKPAAGSRLRDVPPETQYLLGRLDDGQWLLLVPLVEDRFRYSLRAKPDRDELVLVGETGDAQTPGEGGLALYLAVGEDPDTLVRDGARSVVERLGTGRLRRDKEVPDFVDTFGWCTWDAFYQDVSAELVLRGLASFAAGGVSPRFLILDDGWQSTRRMPTGEKRLTAFAANEKFSGGLAPLVARAKEEHAISCFLVWHAVVGYWGGVDQEGLPAYDVVPQTRHFGDGILHHMPTFNEEWWGPLVGFVPSSRISQFYDDYHASLAAAGVDGIKVDSQAVLEALAQGQGGRVAVTRAYRQALESSARKHFAGRLINCMSNAPETWYGSPDSTLLRSSIDFFPTMPETHGSHLYANAQVGLWFGEFMHPDWDMFQSGHEFGAYHAAGRAVSGGPVYVSDKPDAHDFGLLSKLVCSDGRVLRCDGPGRPTLDTLCHDPTREDVLLKIRNTSGAAGVVGVFNAQTRTEARDQPPIHGTVGPADVPQLSGDRFAAFSHVANRLDEVGRATRLGLTLGYREFEIVTFAPVAHGLAAVGLADKLNSAGALASVTVSATTLTAELRDGGEFVALVKRPPRSVEVDGAATTYQHDPDSGDLRVPIPTPRPNSTCTVVIRC